MASRELQRFAPTARYGKVRRCIRTLLWFAVWAFVGFAVAYGPLNQGLGPASVLSATAVGTLMAFCIQRSMVNRRTRRKWQVRFVWPARFLLVYLIIIVLLQLHATGALPAVRRNFGYQFERLAAALFAHYPSLHELETEWDSLYAIYKPLAAQATDEREFVAVVAQMLAHFDDPQVYVVASEGIEAEATSPVSEPADRDRVHAEVLPSGIGYVAVGSFDSVKGVAGQFDAALEELGDVPALIVDVRQSWGRSFRSAHRVASRLLAEPYTYGTVVFRHRLPHFGWVREMTYTVRPRGDVYMGPIVVLADGQTSRAAEAFVLALKSSGRAVVIGEPTAGLLSLPITFRLPGGEVHFTVGAFKPSSGPEVEGIGVQPDIAVSAHGAELLADEDVVLQAAIDYLIQRL